MQLALPCTYCMHKNVYLFVGQNDSYHLVCPQSSTHHRFQLASSNHTISHLVWSWDFHSSPVLVWWWGIWICKRTQHNLLWYTVPRYWQHIIQWGSSQIYTIIIKLNSKTHCRQANWIEVCFWKLIGWFSPYCLISDPASIAVVKSILKCWFKLIRCCYGGPNVLASLNRLVISEGVPARSCSIMEYNTCGSSTCRIKYHTAIWSGQISIYALFLN